MTLSKHNINLNPVEVTESQNQRILEFLLTGCSLTQMEALKHFGCMRLPSRIHELNCKGWHIQQKMVLTGNGKRIAQYFL
jgi:hypothetical protein